ncbi:hypothetical protein FNV43_RR02717 [Rhamnella rubrinervis]|uniref:Letm1 RBD domain-containing protein n=1 Tax=Rhamnella rubrinervis TaxID=2594499 RepID=A0A8K0MNC2_9ROSA|nr:hypothetical protein FNV43_RR02717 [Rhamnella rubrinervis]
MALRAILQRKRQLFHSLNQPTFLVRGFSTFEHRRSSQSDDLGRVNWVTSLPSATSDYRNEGSVSPVAKDDLSAFIASRSFKHNLFRISTLGNGIERQTLFLLGVKWTLQSIRYTSTAAAGQPEYGSSGDGNGQQVPKQKRKLHQKNVIKRLKDWAKKLSHWKDEFKSTMQHYWLGTKLLWADVRISSRLVPVAVFLIVPFLEFLLPVFLKLFPNMLPSTFQDKMKEEEALKRKLNARLEYAKFLQGTVKEMAKEVQNSRSGEIRKTAEDLDEFMNKASKLFNDELTLDNVSRPRLVNMCKYMGIIPFGTDAYLCFQLWKRLQEIKNDDKMIQAEGVESLSERELIMACRDRGLLRPQSVEENGKRLMFNLAFSVRGKVRPEEAVQATLSSLPDEVVETVGVTALPSEDSVSERRRKLEFLEMQEELIKEEEEKEEEEEAKLKESVSRRDVALEEMTIPTAREAQEQAKGKILDKQEQLCELSRALAVLASASSVSRERQEFLRLVNKEIELYNSMVEKEGTEGEEQAKRAYQAARKDTDDTSEMAMDDKVSSALINRVDAMLQNLEKEIDDVDAKIGDRCIA